MKLLGIRYCTVSKQAEAIASFLGAAGLGLPERDMGASESFQGAVFPASDSSWVEVWPEMDEFSAMTMLQVVVDDADAFAENARKNGLAPKGPMDAHGERIYMMEGPDGLQVSFQSKLAKSEDA
ncbi:MAG: hypothetical protein NXH70_15725 [Hyphomonas sp.]|nr:hypothetical protein [Hyphomonas sp.]